MADTEIYFHPEAPGNYGDTRSVWENNLSNPSDIHERQKVLQQQVSEMIGQIEEKHLEVVLKLKEDGYDTDSAGLKLMIGRKGDFLRIVVIDMGEGMLTSQGNPGIRVFQYREGVGGEVKEDMGGSQGGNLHPADVINYLHYVLETGDPYPVAKEVEM